MNLSPANERKLDRLCKQTGLSAPTVVQKSLDLFRAYVESTANGSEWLFLPNTSVDDYDCLERITVRGLS
jgi:hypothetical protein